VVVAGRVTYTTLTRFVFEFLHGDQILEHHFRLVVLSTEAPNARILSLTQQPRYRDRIKFVHGIPWNQEDLRRVGVGQASAVFVLADFDAPDINKDQDRIVLTAVSVRKYLMRQMDLEDRLAEAGPGPLHWSVEKLRQLRSRDITHMGGSMKRLKCEEDADGELVEGQDIVVSGGVPEGGWGGR
jgi:hypothetical protein